MVSHSVPKTSQSDVNKANKAKGVFRPELEGLRAIGILAVMTYHAHVVIFPGSFAFIDLFFVISGFLITGILIREIEKTGRLSLSGFYARRIRRLLPAATVVLLATTFLTWKFASPLDRSVFGFDIAASAAYIINWVLAFRSVDYLAEDVGASPVQQFWSLAVEEQFYIVWPLILILFIFLVKKYKWPIRPAMGVGLSLIVIPSLIWSIYFTQVDPASAYFVTTTRLWELGVGGLIAVGAAQWKKIPKLHAHVIGWLGLALVLAAGAFFNSSMLWPGYLALVPVLGTAGIIIAGSTGHAPWFLGWRPLIGIGAISYSLYLWHWPLIIAAEWIWGELSILMGLAVVAFTFIPSWASYKFVENPIRFSKRLSKSPRNSILIGVFLTCVSIGAGLLLVSTAPSASNKGVKDTSGIGAQTLEVVDGKVQDLPVVTQADPLIPSPQNATKDVPAAYGDGCQASESDAVPIWCHFGAKDGKHRVVLAGDSKAMQWSEVLSGIAKEQDWKLDTATKSRCPFVIDTIRYLGATGRPYESCKQFNTALMKDLLKSKPDAVIVSQRSSSAIAPGGTMTKDVMVAGMEKTWSTLEDNGIRVIALLDNPGPQIKGYDGQVYRCVQENIQNFTPCVFAAKPAIASSGIPIMTEVAESVPGVQTVGMTDVFCNDTQCPPVVGDVLVYRQTTHISNTYALSTKSILERRLVPKMRIALEGS